MHLPDGILSGHAELVGAVAAAGGLAVAARAARPDLARVPTGRVAAVGALVFAGQMVNVPVASGTSGHLLGAALAVALLGPGLGVLAASAVIVLQALAFADGGVTSVGINVVNMALVPGLVAALVLGRTSATTPAIDAEPGPGAVPLVLAAGLGTVAAAASFSVQYTVAGLGGDPAGSVAAAMLGVHVPIAVAEVVMTLAAVAAVRAVDARPALVAAGAAGVATILAPWASSAPDGLERVAIDRGFASLAGAHRLDASPVADYAVGGVDHVVTVALAGLIGVALVLTALQVADRAARIIVRTP